MNLNIILGIRELNSKPIRDDTLVVVQASLKELFYNSLYEQTSGMPQMPYYLVGQQLYRERTPSIIPTKKHIEDIREAIFQYAIFGMKKKEKKEFGLYKGRVRLTSLKNAFTEDIDSWYDLIDHNKMDVNLGQEIKRIKERVAVRKPTIEEITKLMKKKNISEADTFERNLEDLLNKY